MAGITVSYEELKGKSDEMKKHKETFIDLIRNARTTVNSLSNVWASKAQQNFAEKFEDMDATYKAFEKLLLDYETFLKESAQHYKDADDSISTALGKKGF